MNETECILMAIPASIGPLLHCVSVVAGTQIRLLFGIKHDAEFVVENIYRNAIAQHQPIAV